MSLQEIEAKFLSVYHDKLRRKLEECGAELKFEKREYRRVMFDYPDSRFQKNDHSRRFRIRDEGDKIMLNFKKKTDSSYDDEYEVEVRDFEATIALLKAAGFVTFSYQESRREMWKLDGCEVCLDEWPWVKPYIEIEGPSEDAIKGVAAKLGFDWSNAKFGSVDTVYAAEYTKMKSTDSVGDLPEVKFSMPTPEYFLERQ